MAVLVYCVFLSHAEPERPPAGVAERPIEQIEEGELRCWYSDLGDASLGGLQVRKEGLAFHRVVQAAHAVTAVIPFRFPATFATPLELQQFLQDFGLGFAAELQRLQDAVQMEARIVPVPSGGGAGSGTEYLRARQSALHAASAAASTAQAAVADISREWRQRGTQDGIRCFALVPRSALEQFRRKLAEAPFEKDVRVTISGPWPPTEFLQLTEAGASDKVGSAP